MSKLLKAVGLSAVVLSATAATASADGYGFIKSNVSQFGEPVTLPMQNADGKLRLKSASTMVPIAYEAGYKGSYSYLEAIDVRVEHTTKGKGAVAGLRRDLAKKDKVWGNINLPMTRAQLAPMEKVGRELCAGHDGPGDKRVNTIIPLTMTVSYFDNRDVRAFKRQGIVPATIVCEAPVKRVPPKVSLVQMRLYTVPAKPVCGKPVVLMAEFQSTYPGKVGFRLVRGDGEKQNVSATAVPQGSMFVGRWHKVYTFAKSESRKYKIVAQGQPKSSGWVAMNVKCGLYARNGLRSLQKCRPRLWVAASLVFVSRSTCKRGGGGSLTLTTQVAGGVITLC